MITNPVLLSGSSARRLNGRPKRNFGITRLKLLWKEGKYGLKNIEIIKSPYLKNNEILRCIVGTNNTNFNRNFCGLYGGPIRF
jgi:hypothetical protein